MRNACPFIILLLGIQAAWADFKDPMRPPAYAMEKFRQEKTREKEPRQAQNTVKKSRQARWVLNSILFSAHRKHAIINNKLVKKGGFINGAKLIDLQADRVRLLSKGRIINLKIFDSANGLHSFKKSSGENNI